MTRSMFVRVAVAAVLAIALSAGGARAAAGACGTIPNGVTCAANLLWDELAQAANTASPTPDECCVSEVKCSASAAFDADTFCPYGYTNAVVAAANLRSSADPTVELCCAADATVLNDFPICANGVGGASAVQAQDSADTNWAVHDGTGFTRTVGQYTGMCFSLTTANDCAFGSEATKAKCCTKKPPTYLQFKLPQTAGTPTARANALAALSKCKVSYGSDTANARALKRITTWTKPAGDVTQYFNLPVTFKRGQKQATMCVYALNAAPGGIDCSWTNLCGLDLDPVTAAALGCEIRMVGKATAASSACCSPTLSIDAFDSSESRLADGAPASATIELHGM